MDLAPTDMLDRGAEAMTTSIDTYVSSSSLAEPYAGAMTYLSAAVAFVLFMMLLIVFVRRFT